MAFPIDSFNAACFENLDRSVKAMKTIGEQIRMQNITIVLPMVAHIFTWCTIMFWRHLESRARHLAHDPVVGDRNTQGCDITKKANKRAWWFVVLHSMFADQSLTTSSS